MNIAPYIFKSKAMNALKGNWQTALLVSFFASLPLTVVQLLRSTQLPDLAYFTTYDAMYAAVQAISPKTWLTLGLASTLAMVITPALSVGCNHYFVCRLHGQELGFAGLFSRIRYFFKALLLYLLMWVRVMLWSLLLFVPGIIALLRYSMAPFYLAESPEIGVLEAIRKSKETMKDKKLSYFILELSFVGWLLAALFSQMLLDGISPILGLVVSQFIQLYMTTYLNASCSSFYLAASVPQGMDRAQAEAAAWLNSVSGSMGGSPFGRPGDSGDTQDDNPEDNGETNGDTTPPSSEGDTSGTPKSGSDQ